MNYGRLNARHGLADGMMFSYILNVSARAFLAQRGECIKDLASCHSTIQHSRKGRLSLLITGSTAVFGTAVPWQDFNGDNHLPTWVRSMAIAQSMSRLIPCVSRKIG